MSERDLYDVLGISRDSSDAEIKKAYRDLAKKYHPDRNEGDAESERKFKEAGAAYEILKDKSKRDAYDRFGMAGVDGQSQYGGGRQGFKGGNPFGGGHFSDIFEEFFGSSGGGSRNRRGQDLRYDLEITLEEAFKGTSKHVSFARSGKCKSCNGTGGEGGSEGVTTCSKCMGEGVMRFQQGFFSIEQTCDKCQGRGKVIKTPCGRCRGQGMVKEEKSIDVNIPPGVDDGIRLKVSGEGEMGSSGQRGDLYILTRIRKHDVYRRDGTNLGIRMPIGMIDAILGTNVEIPLLDGSRARVNIKEGTQNGQRLRIGGKGMPSIKGKGRGDLIIDIYVETPVSLTKRQRELLETFREESELANNAPQTKKFFSRLKGLFRG